MSAFVKPPRTHEIWDDLDDVLSDYYPEIRKEKVSIGLLFAYSKKDHALMLHGSPAYAIVKINNPELRVQGIPDATIKIDGREWDAWNRKRRLAVLDHELHHLVLVRDESSGNVKTDDNGRPLLRMRPHDFQVGWFAEVAARHGHHSIEVEQAMVLRDKGGQMTFPWFDAAAAAADLRVHSDAS